MLDISTSTATGMVENLRFMGASHKESIQAPIGILRQDVTLSTQLQEYHRRRCVLNEYRTLVATVRASVAGDSAVLSMPPVVSDSLASPAVNGADTPSNSRAGSQSVSPSDAALLTNFPLPSDVGGKPVEGRPLSRLSALTDPDSRVHSNAASGNMNDSRRLASSLFRAALSLHERYLPCYYCAKDVLQEEFSPHIAQCKLATESLMRKRFLNPLRFADFVPQVPLPPLDCNDDVLDEYAMECSKCIGKSLVDCSICKRKFNIHELQDHGRRCTGRSSGEVLGNYAAYLPAK